MMASLAVKNVRRKMITHNIKGWVNIYPGSEVRGHADFFFTKTVADNNARPGRIACVQVEGYGETE